MSSDLLTLAILFPNIEESNQASVSFSNQEDNNNKIGMTVSILKGQGDII
jgi:hypothetical protein